MTDTAVRQTESAAAAVAEAEQQAAIAAAEQAAMTLLQTYVQEGRAALATSTQAKAAAQAAADRILNACRASVASAQQSGALTPEQAEALNQEIDRIAEALTPAVVRTFMDSLTEALDSRDERVSGVPEEDTQEARRNWAVNAGRTLASRLIAENSVALAKPVEEHLGVKLHKLWMSRGDAKVRSSHRKLHGSTKELDKPFWRELGTGRELSFPGDPRAPIEQTINCRCWLWYVPESQAAEAESTFQMPSSEFELIAASGHAHGSIWDLDKAIVNAAYDVAIGLLAATERAYDEEKHERAATGQFARKPKGSIPPREPYRGVSQFDYAAWEAARGGLGERQFGRRAPGKDGGGGDGGGGGGGGDAAAKREAREALYAEQEAEREAQRVVREKIRTERRSAADKLRAQRRMEDAAKQGRRLSEDEALLEIRDEIAETERAAREKQREADQAAADIERSRDYIRQMRIRGELPAIIDAERQRLLGLEIKHKDIVGEVNKLFEQSRKLGTSDTVRKLRDRVRFSRRAEDDKVRGSREQMDAAIRLKTQEQDDEQRARERAMRARHQAQRQSLRGAGEPSHSCVVVLLPTGDREIAYNDGGTAPMHMTIGDMGDAAQYDDIDREMFGIATEEIADRIPPFTGKVAGQATLGEDSDTVTLVEAPEIQQARDYVMGDGGLGYAIGQADEHPNWIPHVTGLGDAGYQDEVGFDRLGLWLGEDRREYPLNG